MKGLSRKGALDVSINSIVVIIFAVTMLSIGVLFIKNYFDKLVVPDCENPPEPVSSEPITTCHSSYITNRGTPIEVRMRFLNDDSITATAARPSFSCYDGNTEVISSSSPSFDVTVSAPLNVASGDKASFAATITPKNNARLTKYACSVTINAKSKPIFIEVK